MPWGPVWSGGARGERELLAAAYRNSLHLAAEHAVRTVAFPSLSTGAYGYPLAEAARVAIREVGAHCRDQTGMGMIREVVFVLFTADALRAFEEALNQLGTEHLPT